MKKKILIIEDEPLMRRTVTRMLELDGFAPVAAVDGPEGIQMALREQPDLILCDVTMPGMDGYDVLRNLRAEQATRATPFIFLTAKGERHDMRAGMNLGADDYLIKPVSRNDLLAAIAARFERVAQRPAELTLAFDSPEPVQAAFGLTPREAEVLLWVAQGKTNAEVAVILDMSHGTVKKHLEHVFEKTGAENRAAASFRALEVLGAAQK